MSFEEIIENDLADFNKMTVLLIRGVKRNNLLKAFQNGSPVSGRSLGEYLDELIADGSVDDKNGFLRYRHNPVW